MSTRLGMRGADISSLMKSEAMGGRYFDAQGRERGALEILNDYGLNYARLRVWVNSPDGYHGLAQLLAMARRLKALEIGLLVDFHYSDSWADPGKQFKPASWADLDFDGLQRALYAHTREVCAALAAQGTPPQVVQVGNEINHGLLWPEGKLEGADGFDRLAALLKEGARAVRETAPQARVMLHLAEGGNNPLFRGWFDAAAARGVDFDLIGASYYPYWHGSLADLQRNLNDVAARYSRDIVLVETAFPFTAADADGTENVMQFEDWQGCPATPQGQRRMLADIQDVLRAVPKGRCLGFFWWDATWTAVPGNGWDPADPSLGNNWENQALFDFSSRPLPALELFGGVE